MTTFARLREPEWGEAMVECIHNRAIERPVSTDLFIVLEQEVRDKFGIRYDQGEMLIYNPKFEAEMSCMWVAQTIDFDFMEY